MKKILLFTNSEHGQANVFLAASHSLFALTKDVEVYFASFHPISKFVASISGYPLRCSPGGRPLVFCQLDGTSMLDAFLAPEHKFWETVGRRPGLGVTAKFMGQMMRTVVPWSALQLMRVYQSIFGIIDKVSAQVVVVDRMFSPSLTACILRKVRHIVLVPDMVKGFASVVQPWRAMFRKYPT